MVLSMPFSVEGTWVNFSERGPLSTESAAFNAGQETHPWPGQTVGFVNLRMEHGLAARWIGMGGWVWEEL